MKIRQIKLLANRLEPLEHFYHEKIGLSISERTLHSVSFQAGNSTLTFERSQMEGEPFYHFAFNITESKMQQAVEWLKAKGVAITVVDQYSPSWNSHSVYFYDEAGNIVEFIARHNLTSSMSGEFSTADILNISEIGLTAENVPQMSAYLQEHYGMPEFRTGSATFMPIGDEEGLFILAALHRVWYGSDKKSGIFPLEVVMENGTADTAQVPGHPYMIITEQSKP